MVTGITHLGLRAARPTSSPADWDRFAIVACAMVGILVGVAQVVGIAHEPFDALMYWRGWLGDPYGLGPGNYVYPPPMTQMIEPFRWLGWPVFIVAWTTIIWASLGYIAGRWTPLLLVLVFLPIPASHTFVEMAFIGNVTFPMVAAIVLGMRYPAMWAVPLLTKMTPGIGVVWFAFRHEWRKFAIAVGTTAAVAVVSFVLLPASWFGFLELGLANSSGATNGSMVVVGPPLALRLVAAVLLIAWGARTDRPWVVPIACGLAVTGLYGLSSVLAVAVGAIRLTSRAGGPGHVRLRVDGVEQGPVPLPPAARLLIAPPPDSAGSDAGAEPQGTRIEPSSST